MKTKPIKLTEAQERALRTLDENYRFPPRGSDRSYMKLEIFGLAKGDLKLANRDNRSGISNFVRAYKLTEAGKKFLTATAIKKP